jgi:threonine aldolase
MAAGEQVVDLRSDTVTRPTPGMRKAMYEAEVGDDVWGEDPTIDLLQERVAALLGKEAALFVPSGVMGNQVCIHTLTRPGDEVLLHEGGHILNYEGGSAAALSSVQLQPLHGVNGILSPETVRQAVRPREEHFARASVLALENTHNRAGGTVWGIAPYRAVVEAARDEGLLVHLDGARLWNACAATGLPLADYASLADSVSVCFSKGLGAPVGSALAGTAEFVAEARFSRKKYGGAMRQVGILGAAALYALDHHLEWLPEDHEKATLLGDRIGPLPGVDIWHPVETNIVIADVSGLGTAAEAGARLREEGVLVSVATSTSVRFVTHLDVSLEQVRRAAEITERVFAQMWQLTQTM